MSKSLVARFVFITVAFILMLNMASYLRRELEFSFWVSFMVLVVMWILMMQVLNLYFPPPKKINNTPAI